MSALLHLKPYVYVMFCVLLYIGIKRCFPREVPAMRPLISPVVFGMLGIVSLNGLFPHAGVDANAIALAAVLGGAFSRMGYGKRIAAVGAAAAIVRIVGFGVQAACEDDPWLNVLQYLVPLAAMWWGLSQIFRQKVSARVRRKLAKAAPAWAGAA